MTLYFVRHGQTDWNASGKIQGRADIELNEIGIKQAEETGKALQNEKIDLVICSPLKRAKQTAEVICKNRNIPIIYDEGIIERDFGEFEAKNKESLDFTECWNYNENRQFKKMENIREFFDRIYSFLDKVKKQYKDENVLIVAHGGVSIPVNCYFNGMSADNDLLNLAIRNGEIARYQWKQ